MTKERPILFSAPMVRALLNGSKTQTRRIIKVQPPTTDQFPGSTFGLSRKVADGVKMYSLNDHERLPKHPTDYDLVGSVGVARNAGFPMVYRCPYGQPGDRLWVKETWGLNHSDYIRPNPIPKAKPDDLEDDQLVFFATECDAEILNEMPKCPAIFMPRWASRITLEITSVRAERLRDISEADALAEGAYKAPASGRVADSYAAMAIGGVWYARAKTWYADLWRRINGSDSWEANPWVWAVEFKLLSTAHHDDFAAEDARSREEYAYRNDPARLDEADA